MAQWKTGVESGIYDAAARWRETCLVGDGSLWSDAEIWTQANVDELDGLFNGNELLGADKSFGQKFDEQLEHGSDGARRLAAELLAVHFLFTESVSQAGKLAVINRVLGPLGESVSPDNEFGRLMAHGIGGPGVGFNTRRDLQISFLVDFTKRVKALGGSGARELLDDPGETRRFADRTKRKWRREMRHIVLHLLHPDHFERMSSGTHKLLIAEALAEFLPDDDVDRDVDERILLIRRALEEQDIAGSWPRDYLDFYYRPLMGIWRGSAQEDGGEDADGVSLIEALEWSNQAILYGPPGTGKTHRVRELIGLLIRRAALQAWGAKRYFESTERVERLVETRRDWLQLHPAYGYEDFVRGMRIEGGDTVYREGTLLHRINALSAEAAETPDLAEIPWVIVLDEINRTDLSRMLGEAFSLLEPDKRGATAVLPGLQGDAPTEIAIPARLFVIGTMNLIDQSVEQIDFAMRRRFHWHPCPFSRPMLLEIVDVRLRSLGTPRKHREQRALTEQLEVFADRAVAVNRRIAEIDELGEEYEIGHTIFADVARLLHRTISTYSNVRQSYLWDASGAMSPIEDLWRFQLRPLLEQYLASLPAGDRSTTIEDLHELLTAKP